MRRARLAVVEPGLLVEKTMVNARGCNRKSVSLLSAVEFEKRIKVGIK